jgi:CheY-like chemotaxis protein
LRILIADDAAVLRGIFRRIAESGGHQIVAEARDAAEAERAAAEHQPDAIVLDGRLPPAGAFDAIARLLVSAPGASIVVTLAAGERDALRAAERAGAHAALTRPFVAGQVLETLSGLARRS